MPGGHLSYWVYGKLGGERPFGEFWMHLGLPVIAFIAICYLRVGERGFATQRQWMLASIALIVVMMFAVGLRVVT